MRPVARLKARGITTSWDFGWKESLLRDPGFADLMGAVDILFHNDQEALLYARKRSLDAALDVWRRSGNLVVVKLGPQGSRCVSGRVDTAVPAKRVKVVDTTGAGDAFNGGFLAARLRGASLRNALALGNRIGTLSTQRAGGLDGPAGANRGMKLALIGAGGARTPLLVNGLTRCDLPIREISLYDPDQARLARMADLARRHCRDIPLSSHARAEDAIAGADFVFISIRVDGIAARARDEN